MRNFLITLPRFTTPMQVLQEVNKRAEPSEAPPDVDQVSWKENEMTVRMRYDNNAVDRCVCMCVCRLLNEVSLAWAIWFAP